MMLIFGFSVGAVHIERAQITQFYAPALGMEFWLMLAIIHTWQY